MAVKGKSRDQGIRSYSGREKIRHATMESSRKRLRLPAYGIGWNWHRTSPSNLHAKDTRANLWLSDALLFTKRGSRLGKPQEVDEGKKEGTHRKCAQVVSNGAPQVVELEEEKV